jgi:hypothetical protein
MSLLPILLPKWLVEYRRHQQHTEVWHNPSQWVRGTAGRTELEAEVCKMIESKADELTAAPIPPSCLGPDGRSAGRRKKIAENASSRRETDCARSRKSPTTPTIRPIADRVHEGAELGCLGLGPDGHRHRLDRTAGTNSPYSFEPARSSVDSAPVLPRNCFFSSGHVSLQTK